MPDNGQDNDKTHSFMALAVGTTVGHYRIIEKIGAGGMGEVYLAEDTKLNRRVALKFLPSDCCKDEAIMARFQREAQAAAKLSHPSIITIYEVNEFNGRPYFAMEYFEGVSLDEYVKERKLTWQEIIGLAIQIAEGLGDAHRCGIMHRDIKPSNILADKMGRVKILDFGLATIKGTDKLTKTGSTLGTLHYMSPEQTRGEALDERSDVFSFGVVVYEMITGQLPFKGDHEPAIIYSIGYEEPEPLARYKSGVSVKLQGIVSKALAKDKNLRYRHMDEMLADLLREREELSGSGKKPVILTSILGQRRWRLVVGIALITIIAITAADLLITRRPTEYVVPRRTQITFFGDAVMPEISPDGKYLAFVRPGPSRASRVVLVQDLSGGAPITVYEDKGVWDLRWSPDGSELLLSAFNDSVSSLVLVPRMGGSFRRYSMVGTGSTWSPDGTRFATVADRIYFVDKKSGDTSSIAADTVLYDMDWSPNGKLLASTVTDTSGWFISTCDTQGNNVHRITNLFPAIIPKWSAKGDAIYFLEDRGESPPNLFKVRVDAQSGERKGEPILLVSSLQGAQYLYSISADNKKLVFRQQVTSSNLWLAQIEGPGDEKMKTIQLTTGSSEVFEPALSPDGSQIAFAMTVQDEVHIFTIPVEGGSPKQITHTNISNRSPVWSSDGGEIAYMVDYAESPKIAVIDAKGGMPKSIGQSILTNFLVWSPGERILYGTGKNCGLLDPAHGPVGRLMAEDVNGYLSSPCYSPDGHRVALIATEYEGDWHLRGKTKKELAIYSVADHSKLWSMTPEPGTHLLGWSPDGRWLYFAFVYATETTVSRLRIDDRVTAPVINLSWGDVYEIVMGADCSTFVCVRGKSQSDIWMIESFDPDVR